MPARYISITDFETVGQVAAMLGVLTLADHEVPQKTLLGVGVMMSYKTLYGLPTKWADVFPPAKRLGEIFQPFNGVLNTLHYADYKEVDTPRALEVATAWAGPHMHALQFDMVWPSTDTLREYRERHPEIEVILQVSTSALDQVDNKMSKLLVRLARYGDSIDYVLLDKSMGRGLGMDAKELLPLARAIANTFPHLGLVVAGGLGPDTMHLVQPLIEEFPDISLDAQSKLRDSGNALDRINWDRAGNYLRSAIALTTKNS